MGHDRASPAPHHGREGDGPRQRIGVGVVPRGPDAFWWTIILLCVAFLVAWPWYQFRKMLQQRELEECPRCGRLVLAIEQHIKYCLGRHTRRVAFETRILKSFKPGSNVDAIPVPPRRDELEEL
jgi:hypothetical protein